MRPSRYRCFISLLCTFLMVISPVVLPGCEAMPAGSSGPSLTADRIIPGGFFGVRHEAIDKGDTVAVRFRGENGFDVTVRTTAPADGETRVSAPPLINPNTGNFETGDVMVSIDGIDGERPLFIGNPPALEGWERGELLTAYLDMCIARFEEAIVRTGELEEEFSSVGTDDDMNDMMSVIANLQSLRDEFARFRSLEIDLPGSSSTFLIGVEIDALERVLAGMILGATEEMEGMSGSAKIVRGMQLIPVDNPSFQKLFPPDAMQGFERAARQIKDAPLVLLGIVGTGAGLVALAAGAELAAVATVGGIVVTVGGAGYALTSGVLLSESSRALLGEDATGFDLAQESLNQAVTVSINFVGAVPGKIGTLVTSVTTAMGARDTFDKMKDLKCADANKLIHRSQSGALAFCSALNGGGDDDDDPTGESEDDCDLGGFVILSHVTYPDAEVTTCSDPAPLVRVTGTRTRMVITWDPSKTPDIVRVIVDFGSVTPAYSLTADLTVRPVENTVWIQPGVVYGAPPQHESMTVFGDADPIRSGDEVNVLLIQAGGQYFARTTFQAK